MGIIEENHNKKINDLAREDEELERAAKSEDRQPDDPLNDPTTDITEEDIELLDAAEYDENSDEARASDLLDDEDEDGEPLNEGSSERNVFDTGEDLDMPQDVTNPDHDIDEEEE